MELENTIEYGSDGRFMFKFLPFDSSALSLIAREFGGEFHLSRFHLVIFGEPGNDTYVTEENIGEHVGADLSFQSIIKYLMAVKQELTLNKFAFKLGDADFIYDDDSLLLVSIDKNDYGSLNAVFKIILEMVRLEFERHCQNTVRQKE